MVRAIYSLFAKDAAMRWFGLSIVMTLVGVSSISAQQADDPFGAAPAIPAPVQATVQAPRIPVHASPVTANSPVAASTVGDPFGPRGVPAAPPSVVQWLSPTGKIDQAIRQKMAEETKIQFINTPLGEVVGYLKQLHHVQITLAPGLEAAADAADDYTITLNLEDIQFDSGLDFLTQSHRMGWYVEGGMVVVTTEQEAERHLTARMYSLKGIDESSLIETIQEVLEPSSWEANGGTGRISSLARGTLLVWQNRRGHERVEALVTTLNEQSKAK